MLRGVEVSTSARHGEVAASGVEAATRMRLKVAVHDAVAGVWWLAEVLLRDGCHGVAARLLHVCGGEQRPGCGREVAASVCRTEARCDGERRCGGEAAARVWWRDGCMGVAASGGSSRRAAASRGATASGDAMVRRIHAEVRCVTERRRSSEWLRGCSGERWL